MGRRTSSESRWTVCGGNRENPPVKVALISRRSAATGGGRVLGSNGSGCGVGFASVEDAAVEDDGMSLGAVVFGVDGEGLAFSLFVSCEESGASTGSEEGSGAERRGDGPRAGRLGGGICGMGKSLCAVYLVS